jgi:hypothetical protein
MGIMLADTAVGFGGSWALGEVYGRYGDAPGAKGWLAKHSPELLGGTGKVVEGLLTLFVGPGLASGLAGSLGQVGVNAIGLELGLSRARKARNIVVVQVPAGTDVKKLKKGDKVLEATAVGELPAAAAGHGLAWDHIQDLAASH